MSTAPPPWVDPAAWAAALADQPPWDRAYLNEWRTAVRAPIYRGPLPHGILDAGIAAPPIEIPEIEFARLEQGEIDELNRLAHDLPPWVAVWDQGGPRFDRIIRIENRPCITTLPKVPR